MSRCGCLVLVAVCLTSTCAARVLAQASNPPYDSVLDVVGDPAAGDMPANGEAGVSSSMPHSLLRSAAPGIPG